MRHSIYFGVPEDKYHDDVYDSKRQCGKSSVHVGIMWHATFYTINSNLPISFSL